MDEPCLAWFWSPTGTFIVYAQVDRVGNCLRWFRVWVSGGTPEPLGSFWPTRDILFYLHFFDQFVSSHPLISADGRYMVWPGYPAADGQADLSGPPQIYLKDLHDPERPARSIMEGAFAVFAPI
jgi:Tol biopolymer transport system component